MKYNDALTQMIQGKKVKLPNWDGYWFMEDSTIKVYTRTGDVLDTPMINVYKSAENWEVTDGLMSFGGAIHALKAGKCVARKGWNGKGLFIFMQVPAIIPMAVVPNMQSLPESVKKEFTRRHALGDKATNCDPIENNTIKYKNQLAMVYPDNTIFGWVASPSDVLEEDWTILEDVGA